MLVEQNSKSTYFEVGNFRSIKAFKDEYPARRHLMQTTKNNRDEGFEFSHAYINLCIIREKCNTEFCDKTIHNYDVWINMKREERIGFFNDLLKDIDYLNYGSFNENDKRNMELRIKNIIYYYKYVDVPK